MQAPGSLSSKGGGLLLKERESPSEVNTGKRNMNEEKEMAALEQQDIYARGYKNGYTEGVMTGVNRRNVMGVLIALLLALVTGLILGV